MSKEKIYIGSTPLFSDEKAVDGGYVTIENEAFYKISNHTAMPPFFMTLVSHTNLWLFIASNGGITAGRKNADSALFPYATDDKIIDTAELTGSKSIFKVQQNGRMFLWEPFSARYQGVYATQSNLYKSKVGNKIIFEEINETLQLCFRYQWCFSGKFGFVKKAGLQNLGDQSCTIELLDGLQNLLPYGVNSELQNSKSTLVDAYKKNELDPKTGLGIFALSAMIVDRAEPSEALMATTVWSIGLNVDKHLLSATQLSAFRNGDEIATETFEKAKKAAYFINSTIALAAKQSAQWFLVADVNQTHSKIASLQKALGTAANLQNALEADVEAGTELLVNLVVKADGLQLGNDELSTARHFSNVLFNVMRGGLFEDIYAIDVADVKNYMATVNKNVFAQQAEFLAGLGETTSYQILISRAAATKNPDVLRICTEYLPLSFSRRHGDPSRPWNSFSIETSDESGHKIRNYEGNWRDIFQNWEALAYSFPEFVEGMIAKFANASTLDGYNPYRITRSGIDWEVIEPENPWSYIGYWGDHQLIYLLKLLEHSNAHHPGKLGQMLRSQSFVYANVPYRIKGFNAIVENPSDTITFDNEVEETVQSRLKTTGADGKIVWDQNGTVLRANFTEKLLVTALTKLYNFIPEAGIWLNTQRPEWNDANNALVGNGVSMVTLYHLRRFLAFTAELFSAQNHESISLNTAVANLLRDVFGILNSNRNLLNQGISAEDRKAMATALGRAGEHYRTLAYAGFTGAKSEISAADVLALCSLAIEFLDHSISKNKRPDGLYHAYNLIEFAPNGAHIAHLYEMLEGQVAVLSAKVLPAQDALHVLDALKASAMFRPDQYSYMLYPNRQLPAFLEKNTVPQEFVAQSALAALLLQTGDARLLVKDANGNVHFNGNFHNASDVKEALNQLKKEGFATHVQTEEQAFLQAFENVFNHKAFTGRSGTFYGYEGLGCIYWHMVSKLLLAVQENIFSAVNSGASAEIVGRLTEHYYEIRAGIGANKSPEVYGAFPTDAYSHTPGNAGVQQPGMTGQVKEDVLNRWAELGLVVANGTLKINPVILRKSEFLTQPATFVYTDAKGKKQKVTVQQGELAFTYCGVLFIYQQATKPRIVIVHHGGQTTELNNMEIPAELSAALFNRSGEIEKINYEVVF